MWLWTSVNWAHFSPLPILETFIVLSGTQDLPHAKFLRPSLPWIFTLGFCSVETRLFMRTLLPLCPLSCCVPSHALIPLAGGVGGACQLPCHPHHSPFHLQKTPTLKSLLQTIPQPPLAAVIYFLSLLLISLIFLASGSLPFPLKIPVTILAFQHPDKWSFQHLMLLAP